MHKRILIVGTALVMTLFIVSSPSWAAPHLQARSIITYPSDGMTIGGAVDVTGVATHPNIRFYQIRYAAGPRPTGDSQWVDFAIVEATQVEDGVLATWDTTVLPDGDYTLALAVWGVDDAASPYVFFVNNLRVNNAAAPATPTTEPPTPESLPTAVVGPTATPVPVEQPPTPTPLPSPTPGIEEVEESPAPTGDSGFDIPIDFAALRAAFIKGGKATFVLFLLWALYLFIKALIRWILRQGIKVPWQ